MLIVVLGREYGFCKSRGVIGMQGEGLCVRGASLCLSSTGRLDCHLSPMSCSSIASSWPWVGKEQPSDVGRLKCFLTPVPHGSFVSPQRPSVPPLHVC